MISSAMRKKALIVILDGLGDRPIPELAGQTPLEQAHTPNMDKLSSMGMNGLVDPLSPGVPVSTHTGMALLMGLARKDVTKISRGPVEAAGIKLKASPNDVIMRCNFAHVEKQQEQLKILDRRAGRIADTLELTQELQNIHLPHDIVASVYPTTHYRAVLHLQGEIISSQISDTDGIRVSPSFVQPCTALTENESAIKTAEAVNAFTYKANEILVSHPVNHKRIQQGLIPATGIICRSAGKIDEMNNILNYYQLKVAVITGDATVTGLSHLFNFNVFNDEQFTSKSDTNLELKFSQAIKLMNTHDVVYLHIKGSDLLSHDKKLQENITFIEKIDHQLSKLIELSEIIAITADHSTDSTTGFHCGDPVPSLIYAPNGRIDSVNQYSETSCMQGGLGRINASEFLLSIVDQMNATHNFKQDDAAYLFSSENL